MSLTSENGSNHMRPMRLVMLYLMLADGGRHTAAALAEATGAGRRTVYRDIERLRAAGLKVEGTSRLGYRLLEFPELAPLFLTRAERTTLIGLAPAALKTKLRGL